MRCDVKIKYSQLDFCVDTSKGYKCSCPSTNLPSPPVFDYHQTQLPQLNYGDLSDKADELRLAAGRKLLLQAGRQWNNLSNYCATLQQCAQVGRLVWSISSN